MRLSVALLFVSLLTACAAPAARPPADAVRSPVETTRIALEPWASPIETGGVLRARLTATISSRILAPIVAVPVHAGDRVARGQPLVVLDAAELRANAARTDAALETATLAAAAAAAEEGGAEAALTLARTMHERMARLLSQRSATQQELDEATARLAEAEARATAAHAQARAASSALDAARAAAEAAHIAVTYATLAAPFDGIVTDRRIDPGTMAAPGTPLVVVEDPESLQLEISLDASRSALVKVGQSVAVRVDADGADAAWVDGCIAEIARIDPSAHAFAVKVNLPLNPAWRSGLFGRARFAGPTRQALVVAANALVRRGQLTFVFVITPDGRAELRAVSPGETSADRVELLAGAIAGEVVVVSPSPRLHDGALVTTAGGAR